MASILATLFISLELFAVGFAFFYAITEGGWWIAGLIAYAAWLLYLGSIKEAMLNLGTGLGLAVAYLAGGIFASIFLYAALWVFGEIFMQPKKHGNRE